MKFLPRKRSLCCVERLPHVCAFYQCGVDALVRVSWYWQAVVVEVQVEALVEVWVARVDQSANWGRVLVVG